MTPRRSVVITGLGIVGPFGAGKQPLLEALAQGAAPRCREIDRPDGYHAPHGARQAALVEPAVLGPLLPAGAARRMSPPSRFAVAASRLAIADAKLEGAGDALTATVLATAFGPTSFTEKLLRQILLEGPEAASPSYFTECVANAPAAQAAIALGATGPNITLTMRECGPLAAVARGAELIATGRVERALVGTSEELSPLLHAVLDRFRALARGAEVARPFDHARDGVVAAEGAVVLVLEPAETAARRGALPYARIIGHGAAFDPTAGAIGWGHGHDALARALTGMIARAGLSPREIDVVVSTACGSPGCDRLEAHTLRAAFHDALPRVLAPKATTGEYGGGQLAAAVLAAAGAPFGPTHGFDTVDPELGITPHDGSGFEPPAVVVASSLASGGSAAWLVLERT